MVGRAGLFVLRTHLSGQRSALLSHFARLEPFDGSHPYDLIALQFFIMVGRAGFEPATN